MGPFRRQLPVHGNIIICPDRHPSIIRCLSGDRRHVAINDQILVRPDHIIVGGFRVKRPGDRQVAAPDVDDRTTPGVD